MVSGHLIPKAPCASFIFLTGSVVISCPLYPIAYRPRGISGIDSIAGEVLREASTSDIILVAAVATRHIGRCLQKVPSPKQHAGGQDPAALFGDLEGLLDAALGVAGAAPLVVPLVPASTNTPPEATGSWASAPESPLSAALPAASRLGSRRMAASRRR